MNRRMIATTLTAAAAVAVSVGVLAAQPQAATAGASSSHRTYVAHDVPGQLTMADLADPKDGQPGLGDEIAFTQRLTRHGKTVGRASNVAFGVDAQHHLFQANGTLVLPHGTVTFAGLVHQTPHFVMAVTGGTGAYTGRNGTLTFDNKGGKELLTLTWHR